MPGLASRNVPPEGSLPSLLRVLGSSLHYGGPGLPMLQVK